jgi:hypothetical protein
MTDNNNALTGEPEKPKEQPSTSRTAIDSLPPDIQSMIHELREENKDRRNKQAAADKAAQAAEEKRLADNAEWQKLAEARQKRLDELEPIAAQHGTIEAAFNASLDNRLKLIPDDIRKELVDPVRKGMNPVDFSDWLDKNGPRLQVRPAPPLDGGAGRSGGTTASPFGQPTQVDVDMAKATGIPLQNWMKRQFEIKWRKENPSKDWAEFEKTLPKDDK